MMRFALILSLILALPAMAQEATESEPDDFWSMDTPKTPIPPVTDADRAAAFPKLAHDHAHTPEWQSKALMEKLEFWDAEHGTGMAWEGKAWVGSDINRLWLRTAGERVAGETEAADVELLYGHAVSAWWDAVLGVRHDIKPGPSQDFLAVGLIGLAPYKFEVEATAYLGQGGQHGLRLGAEYETLLSSRWMLQPSLEAEFYGQSDPVRGLGEGLNSLEAGLRLRYEISRKFAPYLGWSYVRYFGESADLRHLTGEPVRENQFVAGFRAWF
ncbi:MAG: copper resistance protein B [Xanthomonadaceae bacterium]|jgi:copper resistance protein B|nr:copper resistance protein B [Xanthomonadaceae bacterium]